MTLNHTDTDSWTIEVIISAISETPNKKKKITIPKFQRTLVWNKKQQKAFIDSIKKGFPVGALLLYKTREDQGFTIFNLIDGLQRSTALKQYIDSPTQFYDETNLPSNLVKKIYSLVNPIKNDITEEILCLSLIEWIVNLKGFSEKDNFSSFSLCIHLNDLFELNLDTPQIKEMTSHFIDFLEIIKMESNINQFKIPILIYNGEQSNLPLIFERLNSKGTQLSKYQIYAATWVTYNFFQISNREIIDGIKNKYDLLLEEGYEVEEYDPSPKFYTSEFSTFEYLFGFGKFLCSKFKYLFSGTSKSEQEDSIGFNIMTVCLNLPFTQMNEIPEKLKNHDLNNLEKAIIDSIEFVYNCLKGHITLKMNSRTKISIVHSELQIVSMIGKCFHSKYNDDLTEKSTWNETKEKLSKNLTYHYLYDITRNYWKGSGDSKAYNLITSNKYETEISKTSWEGVFSQWLDDDLLKKEKVRINLKESSLLFYKYLYSYSLTAYEEISDIKYDIEHLIPVDRLKDISGEYGIPISAFPNLCLLDEKLNREKGSLTFYQYFQKKVDNLEVTEPQAKIAIEDLEKYTHTKKEDLDFVDNDFTVENYIKFLNKRFRTIVDLFYSFNNIH